MMTLSKRLFLPFCIAAFAPHAICLAAEVETKIDCESWEQGEPPKEDVFVVDGDVQVTQVDGNTVLTIQPNPITDANAQVGVSAKGSASIQVKVWSAKRARSYPRIGVGLHGISGYRLIVNAALKQLELILEDEVVATAPFAWTTETWVTLRLAATRPESDDGKWTVVASAWGEGEKVPSAPLIQYTDDSGMRGSGKCSIWGTPYSEQPIHFDDLLLKVEVPEEE